MIFKRIFKALNATNIILFFLGGLLFALSFRDVLVLMKPSRDYYDVMENGLNEGDHIEGEIYYSLGCFASKELTTERRDHSTSTSIDAYYYAIPTGGECFAAIRVPKNRVDAMDALTDETYDFMVGDTMEMTKGVEFNGIALDMEKAEDGLKDYFVDYIEDMGYTESEIDDMIAQNGGKVLLLEQRSETACYVMLGLSVILIAASVILYVVHYKKEKAREEAF